MATEISDLIKAIQKRYGEGTIQTANTLKKKEKLFVDNPRLPVGVGKLDYA